MFFFLWRTFERLTRIMPPLEEVVDTLLPLSGNRASWEITNLTPSHCRQKRALQKPGDSKRPVIDYRLANEILIICIDVPCSFQ